MTSRLPAIANDVVVIESDGATSRGAFLRKASEEVRVEGVEAADAPVTSDTLAWLLSRLRKPSGPVIVVTEEATPTVRYAIPGGASLRPEEVDRGSRARGWIRCRGDAGRTEERRLISYLPAERCAWWTETIRALGHALEGIYPLVGTVLAGTRADPSPRLVVQLERNLIAVIEAVGSGCRALELFEEPPTLKRCAELIGAGCPEVSLCGRGVDLSEFGYELVRAEGTWVRLPRIACLGQPLDGSFASLVGAARHAFGLAATDAVACVPPWEL